LEARKLKPKAVKITPENIEADIKAVGSIGAISSILDVVCRTTGMGFAAVARVTDTKWVACATLDYLNFGLVPGGELKLESTLCDEIRQHHQPIIIDHVAEDKRYASHHTPAAYGLQSYISFPIILKNGSFFGTLCAIDPKPAHLNNPQVLGMFKLFADLIAFHLDAAELLALAELRLREEREMAQLRDQFIGILGHDLRNPVGAVMNVAQMMLRMPLDDKMQRLANIVLGSSYRMRALIENVLDFARGQMGGGLPLRRNPDAPIEGYLNQVISELQVLFPGREIETRFEINGPVNLDAERVGQIFSNLLSNALNHGKKDSPIIAFATDTNGAFTLAVANAGKKIPDEVMSRLFQPFYRGAVDPGKDGLGLGLYISAQIAKAHGGVLEATSANDETRFTLTIPATG
jgi:signal transduction histidine kinase